MAKLIMLCGLPTSGKSSYASQMGATKKLNYVILSTDAYIEREAKRLGRTYDEVFSEQVGFATEAMERDRKNAISADLSILWDQTNLTVKSRRRKLAKIPAHYEKAAIWFDIALDEALRRNKLRPGKVIPEDTLIQMNEIFTPPTKLEGFDEVIRIQS